MIVLLHSSHRTIRLRSSAIFAKTRRSIRRARGARRIRVKRIVRQGRSCASIQSSTSKRLVQRRDLYFAIKLTRSDETFTRAIHSRAHGTSSAAAVTILTAIVLVWALGKYGFDTVLAGTWLTLRWLTGIVGFVGVAVVMSYPFRKQVYRRRAGALRYWMLAHVYVGAIAGVVLLFHSGPRTGGLLTSLLYVAFDLTLLSGIVGMVSYWIVPRIMTRIEGEPLLVEDLEGRRKELRSDTRTILEKSDGWLKEEIRDRIYPRFLSWAFLWRQIWRREELKGLLAQARQEFKDRTTRLTTDEERELLIAAVETAVTLRRVDALLTLHWFLRFWIPMHIAATAIMLALMLVHITQVVFFRVN